MSDSEPVHTHIILAQYLAKKQRSSSGYSLRALARDLELSPSFLSRIFSGKKPISFPLLLQICKKLDVDDETVASLKAAHLPEPVRGKVAVQPPALDWSLAGKSEFSVLRQWFYLAILDYTSLENFDGQLSRVAERLGVAQTTVEVAVREMLSAGLLVEVDGIVRKPQRKLRWVSKNQLTEIRKFHDQMLTKAQLQLRTATTEEEFQRRLITGVTVTASPAAVARAKQKLSAVLHEIADDLMSEPGTDVYQLAVQLFPLTKPDKP